MLQVPFGFTVYVPVRVKVLSTPRSTTVCFRSPYLSYGMEARLPELLGSLAMHPMPGSASVSLVNAGLEGFRARRRARDATQASH